MTRLRLISILGIAALAAACDTVNSLPMEPGDEIAASLKLPRRDCTKAKPDITVDASLYGSPDVLVESPGNAYGQTLCPDRFIVDVRNPSISTKFANHHYWIVGGSNYQPATAVECNAHRMDVRTWGRSGSGPWVHVFDYIAQGSWTGTSCQYNWLPSTPPVIAPGTYTRVRSAVTVTTVLGLKLKAIGGVIRL
ncbi:MAG: hypothetical protein L0271_06770 [Gemmatimonadetes bacterium]|nr:hypothetical protein [Gemmatimonadota bacterium]